MEKKRIYKRRRGSFNEEELRRMIELYNKNYPLIDISKELDVTLAFISNLTRYYRGCTTYGTIGNMHKYMLDKIKSEHEKENTTEQNKDIKYFECSILFGLIKLKFKPKY